MLKSTHRPSTLPLPSGWAEHTAPSGHKYYYNASIKTSTYKRPEATPPPNHGEEHQRPLFFDSTAPDPHLRATVNAWDEFHRNADPRNQNNHHNPHRQADHANPAPRPRGHGGDRPKTSAPIPSAEPWILVKTKFARRFVHNTETKQSLWKFPQDVMMKVIEMDRREWEEQRRDKKRAERKEDDGDGEQTAKPRTAVERANEARGNEREEGEERTGRESDDEYEEVEVTDDEGTEDAEHNDTGSSKRPRLDTDHPPQPPNGPLEMDEDDIAYQLAQLEQDDNYTDKDYDYDNNYQDPHDEEDQGLPLTEEDTIALFRSLLDDTGLSPYTTFENIISNTLIVEDPRYTSLPTTSRRREVFDRWSKDRIAAIAEAKAEAEAEAKAGANHDNDPRVVYLRFLAKYATPKLFWPEFKRKYRKAPEMSSYELADKEREKLYRELVSKLRLSEADRSKDLLAVLKELKASGELSRDVSTKYMPLKALSDVRFYVLEGNRRAEIVEGFFGDSIATASLYG